MIKKDTQTGISYKKMGNSTSKQTILFIHGSGCNTSLFQPIARPLNYNCIIVDLPGHGLSDVEPCKSIYEYGKVLSQFIKNIDEDITDQLVCVGHSMGGAIALLLGTDKTIKKLSGLVIVSSGAKTDMDEGFLAKLNNNKLDKIFLLKCCGSLCNYKTYQFFMSKTEKDSVMINDLKTSVDFDVQNKMSSIKVPTLVVMGSKDKLIGTECAFFLKEEIPDCRVKFYTKVAHLLPVVKSAELSVDIDCFIKHINNLKNVY